MNNAAYVDILWDDEASWANFLQDHGQDHETWYDTTLDAGLFVENYPILEWDESESWLDRHQRMHDEVAEEWGLEAAPDLQNWDLSDRQDFEDWVALHALEHSRINLIMGLT